MTTVALVTHRALPELHPHDAPLRAALETRACSVDIVSWDDADYDWSAPRLAVIRSTWDYHRRVDEFLAWTGKVSNLWNPPATVRWNSHKSYLADLSRRGVTVVPTEIVPRIAPTSLGEVLRRRAWPRAIVKPAVSAGAENTWLVSAQDTPAREGDYRKLLERSDVLVQPFLEHLHEHGERSLIFFGGTFSHAVNRSAGMKTPGAPAETVTIIQPSGEDITLAGATLAALEHRAFYARVDIATMDDGKPCLMELELIEPNLFLHLAPHGAERFAELIVHGADAAFG